MPIFRRCWALRRRCTIAGLPFNGPIGAARVGYRDGKYLLNPTRTEQAQFAARAGGGRHAPCGADGRVRGAGYCRKRSCSAPWCSATSRCRWPSSQIRELAAEAGKPRWEWKPPAFEAALAAGGGRTRRSARCPQPIASPRRQQRAHPAGRDQEGPDAGAQRRPRQPQWKADAVVDSELFKLESRIVRERILAGEPRIDGRDLRTVRPITSKVGRAAACAWLGAVHAR